MEGFLVRRDRTTQQEEKGKRYVVVLSPIPHSSQRDCLLSTGDDDNCVVLRISLKPSPATLQQAVQTSSESMLVGKTRTTRGLAVSASGSWLVAIGGHKAYVASTANLKSGFVKFVSPEALTCLAFHPMEEYFATGDEKGNIRLWYCLHETIAAAKPDVEKRAPTSTLHWHAHAVSALSFTLNGAYLLSGGEESVLVIWQIHSGKREFVPRVGAPIDSVAVSRTQSGEEDYLLGLADGSFVFISSMNLKISRSYSGIKLGECFFLGASSSIYLSSRLSDPAISNSRPSTSASTPLAVHSLSSTLILPSSHPSSLQAYSPSSSKLISELEISPSNRVSRRDEKMLKPSRVEQAVVSSSGEWLATIDFREGDEYFRGEVHLKLWRWDSSAGLWTLNTRIDRPHGPARVTSIVFSPSDSSGNILVTSGEDGNVKSWRIRSVANKKLGTSDGGFSLNSKRSLWMTDDPRSVLGSPFERNLQARDSLYCFLVSRWFPPGRRIRCIRRYLRSPFECPYSSLRYFRAARPNTFRPVFGKWWSFSCDLRALRRSPVGPCHAKRQALHVSCPVQCSKTLTYVVQWHYRSAHPVSAVVTHPRGERLAVFSSQPPSSTVSVFHPSASTPLHTYTLPFALRNIVWYPQLSPKAKETSTFHLVGITDNWDVVVCGDDVHPLTGEGLVARGLVASSQGPHSKTLLQDIFGGSALAVGPVEPLVQDIASAVPRNGKEIGDIFAGPAYLIPPLETLFEPLMKHFLTPRAPEDETVPMSGLPRADEEDANMDVDESQENPLLSAARPERVVDAREIDALIELFRHHGVKGKRASNGIVNEWGVLIWSYQQHLLTRPCQTATSQKSMVTLIKR